MIANWLRIQLILMIVVLFNFSAAAQTAGSGTSQAPAAPEAVERGGYVIHQSMRRTTG